MKGQLKRLMHEHMNIHTNSTVPYILPPLAIILTLTLTLTLTSKHEIARFERERTAIP